MRKGGRRRKRILDNLKETRGYWKLKQEALVRNVWRIRFGGGCGTRKTDYRMNECCKKVKKKKVKRSRYRPGVAQRVGRGIALLFHDRGTRTR